MHTHAESKEKQRLNEIHEKQPVFPWYKWGPYVSEREWGTVREDYSVNGDAWNFFSYDMAKSKAYRWGEDGIAGICDRFQILALSFGFWNGKDREIKERLFGLNPSESNHGEDVKEYYYYLDNTPTHSYMKYLYKYPQSSFPYDTLIRESQRRSKEDREYELFDTGVMHLERYFDIFIEYAKLDPEDIMVKLEIVNCGDQEAFLHILPQLVLRNLQYSSQEGSQSVEFSYEIGSKAICMDDQGINRIPKLPFEYSLGKRFFYSSCEAEPIFTNNASNEKILYGKTNKTPYVKDAFHHYVIHKDLKKVHPEKKGTKAAFYIKDIFFRPGESKFFYFRLSPQMLDRPFDAAEALFDLRKKEADEFYDKLHPKEASEDEKNIQRQALSGLLWNKQFYFFDVAQWIDQGTLDKRGLYQREEIRNKHWKHLLSMRVMSMPDKWEYPWFAAWDLAFHAVVFSLIDMQFAKEQIWLLLFDQFQHPNGQIPAYEWEFSEMNPPVQAWAVWKIYQEDVKKTGVKDRNFLKKCFHKLMINFTWWVNKVDAKGNNVFEGGFLGLDNITVIDRSMPAPGGGVLEQSDGTGWMGMFCLTLTRIALELAKEDVVYEITATKFFEHYVYIAAALHTKKGRGVQLWNEKEGFFYDILSLPNGDNQQILVRSLVGIIPLYAMDFITEEELDQLKEFKKNFSWFFNNRKDLVNSCITEMEHKGKKCFLLSLMNKHQIQKVLEKVWDPAEFKSEFGLRSLSKMYEKNPYVFLGKSIMYEPAEAISSLKGGNSNWRGPIWFPTSFLLIDSLKRLHDTLGEEFFIECKGEKITAGDIAKYFALALIKIFKKDASGRRPVFGDAELMQSHPNWKNYLLFYEHFHADNGRGLGASHQTGWTALVASLIQDWL